MDFEVISNSYQYKSFMFVRVLQDGMGIAYYLDLVMAPFLEAVVQSTCHGHKSMYNYGEGNLDSLVNSKSCAKYLLDIQIHSDHKYQPCFSDDDRFSTTG
jgi:hypothetical protein